jgi:hypothetical protein
VTPQDKGAARRTRAAGSGGRSKVSSFDRINEQLP